MIEAPGATAQVNPLYISKKTAYGCALVVILCLGCLFVGGMGLQGYLDQASLPIDVKFIVMMAVGGAGVIASLVLIGGLLWSAESRTPKPCAYVESSLSEPGTLIPDANGNFLATPENLQALGVPYFCHEAWQHYLGEKVEPIPLPPHIQTVLSTDYIVSSQDKGGDPKRMGTYRETHSLVLIPSKLSLCQFRIMMEKKGIFLNGHEGRAPHVETGNKLQWILVPKSSSFVFDHNFKNETQQVDRPTALELYICMATYRLVTGQHLYSGLITTQDVGIFTDVGQDTFSVDSSVTQRNAEYPHFAPYRFPPVSCKPRT